MKNHLARKHFERGRQFELQDQIEAASEAYGAAVALGPDFAEPFVSLARIEASRGDHERALELLDEALERDADAQTIEWRAYVLGRLRRYSEALAEYRRILDAGDPQVRVNVARMLLALRRYDEAHEVLESSDEAAAAVLLEALPRYREYQDADRTDDGRAVRYLFGRTLVLGTVGDGSRVVGGAHYLLLTPRHVAATIGRFLRFAELRGWRFDAVVGDGPHHRPVALALSELLDLPYLARAEPDQEVLVCSAVVKGVDVAKVLRGAAGGTRSLHLALGFVPGGDPSLEEPDLVGFANRCAVPWYRVDDYARLVPSDQEFEGEPFSGFEVGPAYIDPNSARVAEELVAACREAEDEDELTDEVLAYFIERHPKARAFDWQREEERS